MACCFYQLRISGKELGGMTALATIGDVRMLIGKKRGRDKVSGRIVTITTYIQCRDVIQLLVDCADRDIIGIAIVAALTIVGDTRVKEGLCRLERIGGGVANDAILGGRQMIYRLSGTDGTVVTGYTIVKHTRMVKKCPGKGSCTEVTVRAILVVGSGRYVINGFTRTDYIVVTIRAQSGGINITRTVVKDAGSKGTRGMANLAILGGRQVDERFPARVNWSHGIAMAGIAAGDQHSRVGMVGTERGTETVGAMAAAAIGRSAYMRGHCGRLGGRVNAIGFIVA